MCEVNTHDFILSNMRNTSYYGGERRNNVTAGGIGRIILL